MQVFRDIRIDHVDLSYSVLESSGWDDCEFSDVIFKYVDAANIVLWGCRLHSVSFHDADLEGAALAANSLTSATTLHECDFTNALFQRTAHSTTLYDACTFRSTDLFGVDFDGARFDRCLFAGLVSNCSFHAHSKRTFVGGRLVDAALTPLNRMDTVDFSNAILRGVNFEGVDLSTCTFPKDERHLLIGRQNDVFERVREIVRGTWSVDEREAALTYLEWNHLTPNIVPNSGITEEKLRQPIDVINLDDLVEFIDPITGPKLYDLIGEVAKEVK